MEEILAREQRTDREPRDLHRGPHGSLRGHRSSARGVGFRIKKRPAYEALVLEAPRMHDTAVVVGPRSE